MTKTYYAKYLLRYLRCAQFEREIQNYTPNQNEDLVKGAHLVSRWEFMSQEKVPEWEYVEQQIETLKMKVEDILNGDAQKSKKTGEITKKKTEAMLKAVFIDKRFEINTVADNNQNKWDEIKDNYNITEVKKKFKMIKNCL